jgi:hypothetical protein
MSLNPRVIHGFHFSASRHIAATATASTSH